MQDQSIDTVASARADEKLPDWELVFRFSSGRLCLAFCARVGERWRRNFERLCTPDDLGHWAVAAGLVDQAPPVSARLLDEARTLREAVYRLVRSAMADHPIDVADRELLNAWASKPDLAPNSKPVAVGPAERSAIRLGPPGQSEAIIQPPRGSAGAALRVTCSVLGHIPS